jgi:hypothetical protein
MCRWVAKGTRRCPSQERPRRQMCVPKSPHTHKKCVTRFKWLTMSGVHSCAGILSLVFKHGAWKQMTFLRLHNNVVKVEAFLTLGCFCRRLLCRSRPPSLRCSRQTASMHPPMTACLRRLPARGLLRARTLRHPRLLLPPAVSSPCPSMPWWASLFNP